MSIIQGNAHTSAGGGGYQIERSLRFNSADSAYLNRTFGTPTDGKKYTYSGWVKRLDSNGLLLLCEQSNNIEYIQIGPADTVAGTGNILSWRFGDASGPNVKTTAVYRDVSAWYHVVVAYDSTQATASNRIKLYVNGSQVTDLTASYPAQNTNSSLNRNGADVRINSYTGTYIGNGYMTEVNFIDGQALTPSSFGETDSATGVWKPKAYSGTYGTNGFYLKFADNSGTTSTTLGKDSSGNGNNWTPNNFSVTAGAGNDSLVDSPTSYGTDTGVGGEVRGNYCTLNPLDNAQGATFSNGNLQAANATANDKFYRGTFGMSSGKWYWEIQLSTVGNRNALGITDTGLIYNSTTLSGNYALASVGNQGSNTNGTLVGSIPTFADGDYITFAFDADSGILYFEKNAAPNTSTSPKFTGLATTSTYFVTNREPGGTPGTNIFNFGQRAFQYTATSNYKALCTQNLPTPTIGATSTTQANDYFNAVTYSGSSAEQNITGVGFQPDFVWIKSRSNAESHVLSDAVRGATGGSYYRLFSDATAAESANVDNSVLALNADGFRVSGGTAATNVGRSGYTYVSWNWKANGAGSSNTAGTITSTVSASTTSGFSIVTFTADSGTNNFTVGHGLGVTPSMVIVKSRTNAVAPWYVYHSSLVTDGYLRLNATNAVTTDTNQWGTGMTSTVIGLRAGYSTVASTTTVAYCFANVEGYSRAFSYTGNGSSDGPFVFLGFRPKLVWIKRTDTTGWWYPFDTSRNTYNVANSIIELNGALAETTGSNYAIDINSNGFKLRSTHIDVNASGGTYIGFAWAEAPFKYSLGR